MGTVGSALTNGRIRPARSSQGSVSPMCIVQVNVVDSEFLERLVCGLPDIGRRTIDHLPRRCTGTKLGCQKYLTSLPSAFEPVRSRDSAGEAREQRRDKEHLPFTDELFRVAIRVGGVPVGATGLVDSVEHLREDKAWCEKVWNYFYDVTTATWRKRKSP